MLTNLSTAALIILAERDDLTPLMVRAITAEIRTRCEALEAAARRDSLAAYWAGSVSASVAADYRSGNVRTIKAG